MSERARIIAAVFVTALGAGVFLTTTVHAIFYAPDTEAPASSTLEASAPAAKVPPAQLPKRLQIPTLGIDTNILEVGLGKTGHMAVPPNFTDVAWYKYGTLPGQVGSAVMDGHVDNGLGLDGVFKHLGDIKVGDDVYVTEQDGTKLHFKVEDIEAYPYLSVPLAEVFNRADKARLNLITCEGAWVAGQKTYDHRLVIYTTLVS